MKLMTGMPDASQLPQQIALPPQDMRPPSDMIVDVLGIRVPAAMLESGYFWAFLIVVAVVVLGVAYFKYHEGNDSLL
jgi:hypothetical protein